MTIAIGEFHRVTIGTFRAAVPSGASTGTHEAVELRDGDPVCFRLPVKAKETHLGRGVEKAVTNVNEKIGPALVAEGLKVEDQVEVDALMALLDGTDQKCGQFKAKLFSQPRSQRYSWSLPCRG